MKDIPFTSKQWGPCVIREIGKYADGTTCLRLFSEIEELIATLTISIALPDTQLEMLKEFPDVFVMKTYSENKEIAEELLSSGIFEETGIVENSGFVTVPFWRLKGAVG